MRQIRAIVTKLRTAIAAASLALVLVAGCTTASSPTLPVPPPAALSSAPNDEGVVTITGTGAIEGAFVSALNEQSEEGRIVRANDLGEFEIQIGAEVGNSIIVWQTLGTRTSELVTVIVPAE